VVKQVLNATSHVHGTIYTPYPEIKGATIFLWSTYVIGQTIIFAGSIARSGSRRYLIYSEADFEVFRPQGRHVAPMGMKFGVKEGSPPPRQISPQSVQQQGCKTPKLKFSLRFDQNVQYKRPAGAYPLRDFQKICRVCIHFRMRQLLKFGWICSTVYGVMGY